METVPISTSLIKEAYGAACKEWKVKIRQAAPELFDNSLIVRNVLKEAGIHTVYGYGITIVEDAVLIPMPFVNPEWTWQGYEMQRRIYELLKEKTSLEVWPSLRPRDIEKHESKAITKIYLVVTFE